MDVVLAVSNYVNKLVSTPSTIKVLLLDSHTTPFISLASTQSDLLAHQVYLTDRIDNAKRDKMPHLKCVCFLSTSEESLDAMVAELEQPRYGEYYLCQSNCRWRTFYHWAYPLMDILSPVDFSNVLTKRAIEKLAEADSYEVVHEVQEVFADFAPIMPSLFSLNQTPTPSSPLYGNSSSTWNPNALDRAAHGLAAVLLSLKKKPIIRYERKSGMARKLGAELQHFIKSNQALFEFRPTQVPPLLLIVDRLNDPVTPLLSQWTYQAMVHELLGIQNGRVDLSLVPDIRPELREITLVPKNDWFFGQHLNSNFGDLGASIQTLVKDYQTKTASQTSIETIADMKRFVEEYPEFRKMGGNVSKHVALMGELSRIVARDNLFNVSEVEQGLAGGGGGHANDLKAVQALIAAPEVSSANKLRLGILYALRYQTSNNSIPQIRDLLVQNGVSDQDVKLMNIILHAAGADQRQDDLFSDGNIFSRGKSALKGLKGVENVYTQHSPQLSETVEMLLKGRLKETSYPFLDTAEASTGIGGSTVSGPNGGQRPQDVIIFMVGGTTYEEARAVSLVNQELSKAPGGATTRLLLGGTCIHNSSSFLQQLTTAPFPASYSESAPGLSESASAPVGDNRPALALNLGGINLSVGGSTPGIYRTNSDAIGVQAEGLRDGVRDGVREIWGKVRQGVERLG